MTPVQKFWYVAVAVTPYCAYRTRDRDSNRVAKDTDGDGFWRAGADIRRAILDIRDGRATTPAELNATVARHRGERREILDGIGTYQEAAQRLRDQ